MIEVNICKYIFNWIATNNYTNEIKSKVNKQE